MEAKLYRIVDELMGLSRREWELIRGKIDEAYDAAARRVVFDEDMGLGVLRRLASEDGLGKAAQPEGNKQMRTW